MCKTQGRLHHPVNRNVRKDEMMTHFWPSVYKKPERQRPLPSKSEEGGCEEPAYVCSSTQQGTVSNLRYRALSMRTVPSGGTSHCPANGQSERGRDWPQGDLIACKRKGNKTEPQTHTHTSCYFPRGWLLSDIAFNVGKLQACCTECEQYCLF